MNYPDIIKKLEDKALDPKKAVAGTMKETGKDVFGCFPIYTPEEIIYASGMIPVGMWGGPTELKLADRYLQSFCCSIMRSNIEYGMKGTYDMLKGIVLPTFCDTLKCICENWKVAVPQIPVIPVVYPQNRRIVAGITYTITELQRVRDEISALTGTEINDEKIEEAWDLYEEYRKVMREFTDITSQHSCHYFQETPCTRSTLLVHNKIDDFSILIQLYSFSILASDIDYRPYSCHEKTDSSGMTCYLGYLLIGILKIHPAISGRHCKKHIFFRYARLFQHIVDHLSVCICAGSFVYYRHSCHFHIFIQQCCLGG